MGDNELVNSLSKLGNTVTRHIDLFSISLSLLCTLTYSTNSVNLLLSWFRLYFFEFIHIVYLVIIHDYFLLSHVLLILYIVF